jgi:hypothetical protein
MRAGEAQYAVGHAESQFGAWRGPMLAEPRKAREKEIDERDGMKSKCEP